MASKTERLSDANQCRVANLYAGCFMLTGIPIAQLSVRLAEVGAGYIRRRNRKRVEELTRAANIHHAQVTSFCSECRSAEEGGRLTEERRRDLLRSKAELLAESERFKGRCAELQSAQLFAGAKVLNLVVASVQARMSRIHRKHQSFRRIFSQIETSHTFYWDLLVCFVLPGEYIEEQLGDLNEEYLLRSSTDGEAAALAWYGCQVIRSVKDRLWRRLECLAAIGTLIDFVQRWFRS